MATFRRIAKESCPSRRSAGAVSPTSSSYTIGGLPPAKSFQLTIWNQAGDGLVGAPTPVATDVAGVVAISVPQHAIFALKG